MANSVKDSGDGVALQVTKPARSANLVEENAEGDATYLAAVRVYSFDDVLLVVDADPRRVAPADVAELVTTMARDTKSVYQAIDATVKPAGHGYQVQLPPAGDAGFAVGDTAPVHPAPGILVVTKQDRDRARMARDVVSIRRDQVG